MDVYLKRENLQLTGSFKVRGAVAAMARLPEADRRDGVVACSARNHGLGLAFAARIFGAPCTIVVPRTVSTVKEEGILALGAQVVRVPDDGYDRTQAWTMAQLPDLGGTSIPPCEDHAVMAGNGGPMGSVSADKRARRRHAG